MRTIRDEVTGPVQWDEEVELFQGVVPSILGSHTNRISFCRREERAYTLQNGHRPTLQVAMASATHHYRHYRLPP